VFCQKKHKNENFYRFPKKLNFYEIHECYLLFLFVWNFLPVVIRSCGLEFHSFRESCWFRVLYSVQAPRCVLLKMCINKRIKKNYYGVVCSMIMVSFCSFYNHWTIPFVKTQDTVVEGEVYEIHIKRKPLRNIHCNKSSCSIRSTCIIDRNMSDAVLIHNKSTFLKQQFSIIFD
jgi:hypothetical protein